MSHAPTVPGLHANSMPLKRAATCVPTAKSCSWIGPRTLAASASAFLLAAAVASSFACALSAAASAARRASFFRRASSMSSASAASRSALASAFASCAASASAWAASAWAASAWAAAAAAAASLSLLSAGPAAGEVAGSVESGKAPLAGLLKEISALRIFLIDFDLLGAHCTKIRSHATCCSWSPSSYSIE